MKPEDKPQFPWNQKTMRARLFDCVFLLNVHLFMTYAEAEKVKRRILKWIDRERKRERPHPDFAAFGTSREHSTGPLLPCGKAV